MGKWKGLMERNKKQPKIDSFSTLSSSATVESQKELRNFRIRPYPCSSISVADFQFLTKIGQGAFGEVWFGRSLRDNKLCAIKAIDKRNTNYPPVTEYLGAGDVFDKLAVIGYLDEYDAKLLVAEMACALDDLRKCGVVHRDFNTENILVENHGHLKLTDFGLSKFIWRRRTSSGTGTMVIRAPKMIRGAEYDYSADWYSLRVFAYEIIFCRTPFMNHLNSLPKDVFYDKLMSKDPKTRLVGLADIMKHPWLSELELYKSYYYYYNPRNWILEPYQSRRASLSIRTFISHIYRALREALEDHHSLLIYSGGQTRKTSIQAISETASYLRLSHQLGLLTGLGLNPGRITTEEFTTNILTSILEQVTVVGHTVKSSQFREFNLQALRYPKASFDYITTAPEESDRIFYKPRSKRTDDGGGGEAWGRARGEEFQRGC
ncbi:kinase-like domain-containing protein [Phakopsora pachyrhizi]|uniref:non-specific serine/threonine protein kinase n=1 Tax=Phakopsora pachyrhizi TaxID=170000 RepID=A0AAV0BSM4_PHAPC|nr:kinase-like domain-containing protein [Phakopsora pachyrhizi]